MKKSQSFLAFLLACLLAFACASTAFAAPVVYKDENTGYSFTVPDGWVEKPLMQDRETIQVKYEPEDAGLNSTMMYGSFDSFSRMSASEKLLNPRETLNNSLLTVEDVEGVVMQGMENSQVSKVEYAGIDWFRCEGTQVMNAGSTSVSIKMLSFLRWDNGWQISLQFVGDLPSETLIEGVLNSMKLPETVETTGSTEPSTAYVPPVSRSAADEATAQWTTSSDMSHAYKTGYRIGYTMGMLFFFALLLAIVTVPILLIVRHKKKKAAKQQATQFASPEMNQPPYPPQPQSYGTAETAYNPYPQQPQMPAQPQSVETEETEQYTYMPPQTAAPPAQEPNKPATAPVAQFCMHCGNRLAEHAVFCPVCGKKVEKLQ